MTFRLGRPGGTVNPLQTSSSVATGGRFSYNHEFTGFGIVIPRAFAITVCLRWELGIKAWFKKGSDTFAGTARRVLCTKVSDPFLNFAGSR
jgi:hypothetical protein